MNEPPTVLLFGHDPHLLETRCLILERAGFSVRTVNQLAKFKDAGAVQVPTVVVLCHTLDVDECAKALEIASAQWPEAKRLVLTAGSRPFPERARKYIMDAAEGPARLVGRITRLAGTPMTSYSHSY